MSKSLVSAAGIGDVRNQHDPNLTYEGENHVLIQQTGNWLLKHWSVVLRGEPYSTPLNSIEFLKDAQTILVTAHFYPDNIEEVFAPNGEFEIYQLA